MKVTWEDLGCPEGPGAYPFRDGTISIRQRESMFGWSAPTLALP